MIKGWYVAISAVGLLLTSPRTSVIPAAVVAALVGASVAATGTASVATVSTVVAALVGASVATTGTASVAAAVLCVAALGVVAFPSGVAMVPHAASAISVSEAREINMSLRDVVFKVIYSPGCFVESRV